MNRNLSNRSGHTFGVTAGQQFTDLTDGSDEVVMEQVGGNATNGYHI